MVKVILVMLVMAFGLCSSVSGIEEAFCAGVGYGHRKLDGLGLKSLGASAWYSHPLNTFWGANHYQVTPTQTNRLVITISSVEATRADGTFGVANGWLRLDVSRANGGRFTAVAVWALSDERESIGEFVYFRDAPCKSSEWAEQKSFLPCSGTPINSPSNPNMFIYSNKEGHKTGVTKISLLWKADLSYCNKPKEFRFFAAVNSERWDSLKGKIPQFGLSGTDPKIPNQQEFAPIVYSTSAITPHFYGPAAALSPTSIPCSRTPTRIIDVKPAWLKVAVSKGLYGAELDVAPNKYYNYRWSPASGRPTKLPAEVEKNFLDRVVCKAHSTVRDFVTFGGRCVAFQNASKGRVRTDSTTVPLCLGSFDTTDKSQFKERYYDFVDNRAEGLLTTGCSCPAVPTKTTVEAVRSIDLAKVDAIPYEVVGEGCHLHFKGREYDKLGLCKNSAAGKKVQHTRIWHALTTLFTVMVIIPISSYMARFLKGRMHDPEAVAQHHAHVIPINQWYIIHVMLVLPTVCMYLTGIRSILVQYEILGRSHSKFATLHRHCAIALMCMLGFQCVNGLLRPINLKWRKFAIYLHCFGGYVTYLGGAVMCILTYRIPSSPFSFKSHIDPDFKYLGSHFSPTIVLGWFVADIVFRAFTQQTLLFQIYIIRYDRVVFNLNMHVGCYFPIILPLPMDNYSIEAHVEFERQDRSLYRIFYFYISFCFLSYFMVCFSFMLNKGVGHGFGWMQCTHNSKGEFVTGSRNHTGDWKGVLQKKMFCSDF